METIPNQNQALAKTIVTVLPMLAKILRTKARGMGNQLILSQLRLLNGLAVQPMTMSELALAMEVTKPTMTRTIAALQKRGWVERTRSEQDRRVVKISLSAAGQAVLADAGHYLTSELGSLLAPLSDADKATLQTAFTILDSLLQSANGEAVDQSPTVSHSPQD